MIIREHLENDPNPIKYLLIGLFGVLLLALIMVLMAEDWRDFIKAVTSREDLIRITAGMGLSPAVLVLLLIFALGTFGQVLTLIAKYTQHPALLDHDPSKSWIGLCIRTFFYALFFCVGLFFMLPLFSGTIAKELGYEYYCPQKARIPGQSSRFYRYTYAGSPLLCPGADDEK